MNGISTKSLDMSSDRPYFLELESDGGNSLRGYSEALGESPTANNEEKRNTTPKLHEDEECSDQVLEDFAECLEIASIISPGDWLQFELQEQLSQDGEENTQDLNLLEEFMDQEFITDPVKDKKFQEDDTNDYISICLGEASCGRSSEKRCVESKEESEEDCCDSKDGVTLSNANKKGRFEKSHLNVKSSFETDDDSMDRVEKIESWRTSLIKSQSFIKNDNCDRLYIRDLFTSERLEDCATSNKLSEKNIFTRKRHCVNEDCHNLNGNLVSSSLSKRNKRDFWNRNVSNENFIGNNSPTVVDGDTFSDGDEPTKAKGGSIERFDKSNNTTLKKERMLAIAEDLSIQPSKDNIFLCSDNIPIKLNSNRTENACFSSGTDMLSMDYSREFTICKYGTNFVNSTFFNNIKISEDPFHYKDNFLPTCVLNRYTWSSSSTGDARYIGSKFLNHTTLFFKSVMSLPKINILWPDKITIMNKTLIAGSVTRIRKGSFNESDDLSISGRHCSDKSIVVGRFMDASMFSVGNFPIKNVCNMSSSNALGGNYFNFVSDGNIFNAHANQNYNIKGNSRYFNDSYSCRPRNIDFISSSNTQAYNSLKNIANYYNVDNPKVVDVETSSEISNSYGYLDFENAVKISQNRDLKNPIVKDCDIDFLSNSTQMNCSFSTDSVVKRTNPKYFNISVEPDLSMLTGLSMFTGPFSVNCNKKNCITSAIGKFGNVHNELSLDYSDSLSNSVPESTCINECSSFVESTCINECSSFVESTCINECSSFVERICFAANYINYNANIIERVCIFDDENSDKNTPFHPPNSYSAVQTKLQYNIMENGCKDGESVNEIVDKNEGSIIHNYFGNERLQYVNKSKKLCNKNIFNIGLFKSTGKLSKDTALAKNVQKGSNANHINFKSVLSHNQFSSLNQFFYINCSNISINVDKQKKQLFNVSKYKFQSNLQSDSYQNFTEKFKLVKINKNLKRSKEIRCLNKQSIDVIGSNIPSATKTEYKTEMILKVDGMVMDLIHSQKSVSKIDVPRFKPGNMGVNSNPSNLVSNYFKESLSSEVCCDYKQCDYFACRNKFNHRENVYKIGVVFNNGLLNVKSSELSSIPRKPAKTQNCNECMSKQNLFIESVVLENVLKFPKSILNKNDNISDLKFKSQNLGVYENYNLHNVDITQCHFNDSIENISLNIDKFDAKVDFRKDVCVDSESRSSCAEDVMKSSDNAKTHAVDCCCTLWKRGGPNESCEMNEECKRIVHLNAELRNKFPNSSIDKCCFMNQNKDSLSRIENNCTACVDCSLAVNKTIDCLIDKQNTMENNVHTDKCVHCCTYKKSLNKNLPITVCERQLHNENSKLREMLILDEEKVYTCNKCSFNTSKLSNLESHLKLHDVDKAYICDMCPYSTQFRHVLEHHKLGHSANKKFQCDSCTFSCDVVEGLRRHKTLHKLVSPICCPDCPFKSVFKDVVNRHRAIHKNVIGFDCKECGFHCRHIGAYQRHVKSHVPSTVCSLSKVYSCEFCNLTFDQLDMFSVHKKTHEQILTTFSCDVCYCLCKNKYSLRKHKLIHNNEKPFKCKECPYETHSSSDFTKHLRKHSGVKSFKCDQCPFECLLLGHLKRHKLIHSNNKQFKCGQCNYSCVRADYLKVHLQTHTKGFSCEECEYRTTQMRHLKAHRLIHTGQKPFTCDNCDFKTRTLKHLNRHVKFNCKVKKQILQKTAT